MKTPNLQRRDLLKMALHASAIGIGSLYVPLSVRNAQSQMRATTNAGADAQAACAQPKEFFVMIRCRGGMDVTLGLDPYEHANGTTNNDIFIEYRPDQITRDGDLLLGPACASLRKHAPSLLAINGISMRSDIGHEACNDYMASGRANNTAAALPIELASVMSSGPLGVINMPVRFTIPMGRRSPTLSSPRDVENFSSNSDPSLSLLEAAAEEGTTNFERAAKNLLDAQRLAGQLVQRLREMEGGRGGSEELRMAAAMAASFTVGASRFGMMEIDRDPAMDTHTSHEGAHLRLQTEIWTIVSSIFDMFKATPYCGGTLFDRTTFMVTNEFARTPALNASRGKDHNAFTNSLLLAGNKIIGGRTIGGTHVIKRSEGRGGMPQHKASPFNYKEGRVSTSEEFSRLVRDPAMANARDFGLIYPENIARVIGELFGMPDGFTVADARMLPGVIKR